MIQGGNGEIIHIIKPGVLSVWAVEIVGVLDQCGIASLGLFGGSVDEL